VTTSETLRDNADALRAQVLTAWAERDAERAGKARPITSATSSSARTIGCAPDPPTPAQAIRPALGEARSRSAQPLNLGLEDLEQTVSAARAEQEKADPVLRRSRSESGGPAAARCRITFRGSRS
jgi:hypothetical protein